jgi:TetR/AcrR family fatty acid metabolism transcriptional regulator
MPQIQDQKKEKKRRAIIRASLRVFARKGYETSALDEVAREAHLAKGTLYLYFKDKEDLYFQVMLSVLERLEIYVGQQTKPSHNPLEKMEALARGQISFLTDNPNYLSLFMVAFSPQMATVHKRIMEPLFEKRKRLSEYLHEIVEEGKAGGFIRGDIDTRDVVFSYMGMVNQAMQSVFFARMGKKLSTAPAASAAETAQAIMKILVQGIAAKPEGGDGK